MFIKKSGIQHKRILNYNDSRDFGQHAKNIYDDHVKSIQTVLQDYSRERSNKACRVYKRYRMLILKGGLQRGWEYSVAA